MGLPASSLLLPEARHWTSLALSVPKPGPGRPEKWVLVSRAHSLALMLPQCPHLSTIHPQLWDLPRTVWVWCRGPARSLSPRSWMGLGALPPQPPLGPSPASPLSLSQAAGERGWGLSLLGMTLQARPLVCSCNPEGGFSPGRSWVLGGGGVVNISEPCGAGRRVPEHKLPAQHHTASTVRPGTHWSPPPEESRIAGQKRVRAEGTLTNRQCLYPFYRRDDWGSENSWGLF